MLSQSKEMVPLGATQESPHIKTEPQELHPEGASQEDRNQGAWGWTPLSQGSTEKALFLPGRGEEKDVERSTFLSGSCEVEAHSPGGERSLPWSGEMPGCLPTHLLEPPLVASEPIAPLLEWGEGWGLRQPWMYQA